MLRNFWQPELYVQCECMYTRGACVFSICCHVLNAMYGYKIGAKYINLCDNIFDIRLHCYLEMVVFKRTATATTPSPPRNRKKINGKMLKWLGLLAAHVWCIHAQYLVRAITHKRHIIFRDFMPLLPMWRFRVSLTELLLSLTAFILCVHSCTEHTNEAQTTHTRTLRIRMDFVWFIAMFLRLNV